MGLPQKKKNIPQRVPNDNAKSNKPNSTQHIFSTLPPTPSHAIDHTYVYIADIWTDIAARLQHVYQTFALVVYVPGSSRYPDATAQIKVQSHSQKKREEDVKHSKSAYASALKVAKPLSGTHECVRDV